MNYSSLILRAIPMISKGTVSLEEFVASTGLGKKTSLDLFSFLTRNGVGMPYSVHQMEFGPLDRMHAALLAIRTGSDVEELSKVLAWKDFEVLASKILEASGYLTYHQLRLKKPRAEIDVVGIKDRMALLVDCKHWKHGTPSHLRRFAIKQIERAEAFARRAREQEEEILFAVPAIITLHSESILFAEGVPVIPIVKFRSFLQELHGFLDAMMRVTV